MTTTTNACNTALSLFKFIKKHDIEYHWRDHNDVQDVIIFPRGGHIEEFTKILGAAYFDDGGIRCTLMDGYIAIWMGDICERFDIDMAEVFSRDNDDL